MEDNVSSKRSFDSIFRPMPFMTQVTINLLDIVPGFEGTADDPERIWIIPHYQRPRVWTDEQSSSFVGVMITGGICPPCWINRNLYMDDMEIIDGQQRLLSLYYWLKGAIHATHPITGEAIFVHEIEQEDLRRLSRKVEMKVIYVDISLPERLSLYIRLNAGGTPHTPEEIQYVRNLLAEFQVS